MHSYNIYQAPTKCQTLSAGTTTESGADKICILIAQTNKPTEKIDVWSSQGVSAVRKVRQDKADGDRWEKDTLFYMRWSGRASLLGQRHAGSEGVSDTDAQGTACQAGAVAGGQALGWKPVG